MTAVSMSLVGIGKATGPFFCAYVKHQYALPPPQVGQIPKMMTNMSANSVQVDKFERLRLIVALAVYGMILPCVLFSRKLWTSRQSRDITFLVAMLSAVLVSLGALEIGLAHDMVALLSGKLLRLSKVWCHR